jgi:hypothetical protein
MASCPIPLHWPWRFCFLYRRHTAFISHELGLVLLFANCSILRVLVSSSLVLFWARLRQCASVTNGLQSYRYLPCGFNRHSHFNLMGGHGTHPCKVIHRLQGSFQLHRHDYQPSRCCFAVAHHTGNWMQLRIRVRNGIGNYLVPRWALL